MKYILVTGGVISGVGKGVLTSCIGALLQAANKTVTAIKIDPYLNEDAGTFSPYEHGEVFVLNDGSEVDLDLGNYERFLNVELNSKNNITTGKVYHHVRTKERRGDYLGKTVTVIPHITNAIQDFIKNAADTSTDICLIELGGTMGDIEIMPFTEALRQLKRQAGVGNFCCFHVVQLLRSKSTNSLKTKPAQGSSRAMIASSLFPDFIICRHEGPMDISTREKLSFYCEVPIEAVVSVMDLDTIYREPIILEQQGVLETISKCLNMDLSLQDKSLHKWSDLSELAVNAEKSINVALVGKYTSSKDSYTSIRNAIEHACYDYGARPNIRFIDSSLLEEHESSDNQAWNDLRTADCLIVPGGFGYRGIEGKINAINWARLNKMPFLGICLGFQLAVMEYARNILSIEARSAEFDAELNIVSNVEPVVIEMLEYLDPEGKKGGTMRLGLRPTKFVQENSILRKLYGNKEMIEERHRHRYEINPKYIEKIEQAGMKFVGKSIDGSRMEILELDVQTHPFFVAVQFHPEFLSKIFKPSPLFKGLVSAAMRIM